MGVDLGTYRSRIGTFVRQKVYKKESGQLLEAGETWFMGLVLMILLLIGGIESNPGPDQVEQDTNTQHPVNVEEVVNKAMEKLMIQITMQIKNVTDILTTIQNESCSNNKEIVRIKEENKVLKSRLEILEHSERKKNVIISGIKESRDERRKDTQELVFKFFEDRLQCSFTDLHISDAFRIGRRNQKRLICVQFVSTMSKDLVLSRKRWLRGTGVWIDEDFSFEVRQARNVLIPYMKEARNQGVYSVLQGDKLRLNNRLVDVEYCKNNLVINNRGGSSPKNVYGNVIVSRATNNFQSMRKSPNMGQTFVDENAVAQQTVENLIESAATTSGASVNADQQKVTSPRNASAVGPEVIVQHQPEKCLNESAVVIQESGSNLNSVIDSEAREERSRKRNTWFPANVKSRGAGTERRKNRDDSWNRERQTNFQSTIDIMSTPNGSVLSINRDNVKIGYNLRNANQDRKKNSP